MPEKLNEIHFSRLSDNISSDNFALLMLNYSYRKTLLGEYAKILRRFPRWSQPAQNHVVFLSGVQRSGTNMLMRILELSPDTKVFHESDKRVFNHFFCHRSDEIVIKQSRSILPCVIFKALSESHKVLVLSQSFSRSSIIWAYRHYLPVISSNMVRWPGDTNLIAEIVVNRSLGKWRAAAMRDDTYELIRSHFTPDLNIESCQALFWYYRNQLFFDQELDARSNVLVIRYETLVNQTEREFSRIAKFLDIRIPSSSGQFVLPSPAAKSPSLSIAPKIKDLCEEMMCRLDRAFEARHLSSFD